jgi:diguanylate cyclase (GGDEF)-like protein
LKILVVEDEQTGRYLLEQSLIKWGFEPVTAESCEEALSIYLRDKIKFIISDWMMPRGIQGIDLVNIIRESGANSDIGYTYIILLTSKNEPKDVYEGIQAGADDYICKPFDPKELRTRVLLGSRIMTMRDANIALNKEISNLNTELSTLKGSLDLDPQTGLFNRQTTILKLNQELSDIKHSNKQICLLIISIEKLDTLEYTYSYKSTDKIILEISRRIKSVCSPHDIVGSLSGNRYAVISQVTMEKDGMSLVDLIKNAIEDTPVKTTNNLSVNIESKIGIAFSKPNNPIKTDKLISQALYNIMTVQNSLL